MLSLIVGVPGGDEMCSGGRRPRRARGLLEVVGGEGETADGGEGGELISHAGGDLDRWVDVLEGHHWQLRWCRGLFWDGFPLHD